jgi:hypothetical protein
MTTPDAGTPAPDGTGPALRASDAERHEVALRLQDAVARGLLTPDEGSQRMAAAWAARYRTDQHPLTADLPRPAPAAPAPPGWRPLATMAYAQTRASVRRLAAEGPRSPRVVAVVAGLLLGLFLVFAVASFVLHVLVGGGGWHGGGGLGPYGPHHHDLDGDGFR